MLVIQISPKVGFLRALRIMDAASGNTAKTLRCNICQEVLNEDDGSEDVSPCSLFHLSRLAKNEATTGYSDQAENNDSLTAASLQSCRFPSPLCSDTAI